MVTGVIEGDSQDLVGVLECLDSSFFPDVPQLERKVALVGGGHRYLATKSQGAAEILAETQTVLLKPLCRSQEIIIKKTVWKSLLETLNLVCLEHRSEGREKEASSDFRNSFLTLC